MHQHRSVSLRVAHSPTKLGKMRVAEGQLDLFSAPAPAEKKQRVKNHLAERPSREEQRRFGQMYVDNIGLIKFFAAKLCRKYRHCMAAEDIDSCCDIAFLKACRAYTPEKGRLSTIFYCFAQGEVLHFLRDHNWAIKDTHKARMLGSNARRLMDIGWQPAAICKELSCSKQELKEALLATAGVAHDVKGFDLHVCPRMTPWEVLEAEEEAAAS